MEQFVPKDKMSKKEKKKLDEENRVTWEFSPATRVIPNKKAYDRNKAKQEVLREDDY